MFGFRSARGRAILAGVALTLFLVGVVALTVGRNEYNNRQLDKLAQASDAATALEHARAQLYLQMSLLSGLALSPDASLADKYRQAQAELEQDLIRVRADATDRGDETQLALLDDLTARMVEFESAADVAIPLLLEMEPAVARELAASYLPSVRDSIDAMFVDLDQLAQSARADLAAERAAIDYEADITFWLVVALSAVGFVSTAGIAAVFLLSVLHPLASVRLSARAIAAGNLQARAKVFGPEEVASLAHDFNQMTDALAAKTKEYITTTNLTGDIIAKIDGQARWTFLNDAACAFFGKPRERLLGTAAMAVVRAEDAERTAQTVEEARATKEPIRGLVNRMITHAGTRVVEWNVHPLFDDQKEFAGIQMTGRDITRRKEAEEALRQAEQRYRELFEEAPAMYVVCHNQDGVPFVADCNELFVTALGYGRDEVIGRPVADLYTPESRAQLLEGGGFQRALAGQFVAEERQLVTKDGRIVETVIRAVPEIGPDGRVLGTLAMYVDITERKRAEEALGESEARYRLLAENTSDLIWTMDLGLRYTYMSPAVTRMRGYSAEEIVGTTIQETMTPASLETARKALAEELALERTGQADPSRSRKIELEMCCKDGSTIWTEMNVTFLRDAEGKPIGILGVTRDISERKRAEETLRTKDSAIASSISAVALADLDGNLTYVNPSALKMWGYDDEKEMLGRPIHRFWQARENALEVGEALRDKGSWMGEMVAIRRDGSLFDVDMAASTVTDEAGNPICMMGSFLDITERKRAEGALRESEEKYRSLVQDATDGIAIVEGLEVRFVNRTLLEMYGGESEEEMVGRPLTDFVTPEHRELMVERSYAREKGQDAPDHYEFRALRKDGTEFDAELSVSLITCEGKVARQGLIRDVTERKRMDDALRESEARYRLLAENASDLIWTMDLSLRYTYMSPAVTRMRGYTVEEIVGTTVQETMTPASLGVARKALAEQLAIEREGNADPNRSTKLDLEMCCKDGSTIWTEMNMTFLRDAEGTPTGILGVTRDISERKRAEEALRESEMRFRQVAESSRGWIWEVDSEGRYTYSSPVVKDVLGYEPEEVIGKRYHDFFTPEDREQLLPAAEAAFARKEAFFRLINRNVHKEGHVVVLETTAVPMLDAEGNLLGYRGVDQDVTGREKAQEEQQRLHAELETRAITDSLTGLYNHAHFYQRLAHEVERSGRYGHRFALVVMDVDAFKHYNDSRGHQAGDEALRLVAECIQSAMRRSDLAFRYGGDEFVTILLDADVSKAQDIVRRINRRIKARLKELGDPAGEWLGVSAGVACFPEDATTADELVSLADGAMYDAKRLAWARSVMGRARLGGPAGGPAGGPVGGPAVWVAETVHETQTKALSGATSELAAALQDLTAPQVLSEEDLRTLAALSAAAEIKDPYIHGHQERTSHLAATVAQEMGLSPDRVRNLTTAGLLHDLGKVNVGEGILNKPGKLSESELAEVEEHASFGAAMILSGIGGLQPLAPIVRHHHERVDGNGYPDGLARENIPLEARILGVVDAFDAMTHERAYRKALSTEEALGEIRRGAGTLFDRTVVEAFLGVMMRGSGSG